MILGKVGRDTYAREIGLVSDDGRILERGLADLLRSPLARWGLSPKTAILRYARRQLDAADVLPRTTDLVESVLGRMVQLGECVEVSIGGNSYITPTMPRWVRTGKGIGTLLSVAPVPEGVVEQVWGTHVGDIVKRIQVRSDEDHEVLRMAGFKEISIRDWLSPLRYLAHGARRQGAPIRSDGLDLSAFWNVLVSEAEDMAQPLSDEADVRAVGGEPGTYFGSYSAERCEGRWRNDPGEGFWCAYRRGYGTNHWHPTIMVVEGTRCRAMDLYDVDEWRWALLARGHSEQQLERVKHIDGRVQLTFPAPEQLIAMMDILGPREGPWSWQVDKSSPNPWKALR